MKKIAKVVTLFACAILSFARDSAADSDTTVLGYQLQYYRNGHWIAGPTFPTRWGCSDAQWAPGIIGARCVEVRIPVSSVEGVITGQATVIDGDTIEIHGQRIRLVGIDAPEAGQQCLSPYGRPWPCGRDAAFVLADQIDRTTVKCAVAGRDRYDRALARCHAGQIDLSAWMILQGYAVRYYDTEGRYTDFERKAQVARRGIWSGTFDQPSEWRRQN